MKKNRWLKVTPLLISSLLLGQSYVLEWSGPEETWLLGGEQHVTVDFNNDGNPNIVLWDQGNGIISVYDENYTEVWSYNVELSSEPDNRVFYNLTGNSTKEFVYEILDEDTGALNVQVVNTATNVTSVFTIIGAEFRFGADFDSDGLEELVFGVDDFSTNTYHTEIWGYSSTAQISSNNYPEDFQIKQNYPNPFNPSTTIEYKISKSGSVKIQVFNIKGQLVETMDDSFKTPGTYSLKWQPNGLSSGQYYYHIILDGQPTKTKKAIYLK